MVRTHYLGPRVESRRYRTLPSIFAGHTMSLSLLASYSIEISAKIIVVNQP